MLECSPFIQPVEASHLIESVIGAENLVPEKLTCVSESCMSTREPQSFSLAWTGYKEGMDRA